MTGRRALLGGVAALIMLVAGCKDPPPPAKQPAPGASQPEQAAPGAAPDSAADGLDEHAFHMILGVNAHVTVLKATGSLADDGEVSRVAKALGPEVLGVHPFVILEMRVTAPSDLGDEATVLVKGIDPARAGDVLDLDRYLGGATLADLPAKSGPGRPPPAFIGKKLARSLGVAVGERITLAHPRIQDHWVEQDPDARHELLVAGVLDMNGSLPATASRDARDVADEYDERLVLTELAAAQQMVGRGDLILGVELAVKDVTGAPAIGDRLQAELGPSYTVLDWCELNAAAFRDRCAALGRPAAD